MAFDLVLRIFLRQVRPLMSGAGRAWLPALSLLFGGVLALIVFSGLLNGGQGGVVQDVLSAVFWLLLFVAFGFEAATLWGEDRADGTLDQDFVAARGSYLPLILASFMSQIITLCLPLFLVFASLWALGVGTGPLGAGVPLVSLLGLILPILALRMLASALALHGSGLSGAGNLLFLSLAALFFFLSVAGRGDLIWALGLIFAPLCLGILPFTLSLAHRSR